VLFWGDVHLGVRFNAGQTGSDHWFGLFLVLFVEGKDELGLGRVGASGFFKVEFLLDLVVFLGKFFLFIVF